MPDHYPNDWPFSPSNSNESPLHGYRGSSEGGDGVSERVPVGLTIAISREAGARGASIAKRAGEKLGWEVYTQDLIDFVAQDPLFRQELMEKLPARTKEWIEEELHRLHELTRDGGIQDLARLLLALGAQGNVILLGRGAGHLLPSRSTLHVRLVAPMHDRIAYVSQWLRLTEEEAEEQVRKRDSRRADFIVTHFHRKPSDVHLYDVVLNTGLLGEERCADLIVAAAKAKMSAVVGMD